MKRALLYAALAVGLVGGLAIADTPVGTCSTSSARRVTDSLVYLPDGGWNFRCCGAATFTDGGPILWSQGDCTTLLDQSPIPIATSKSACTTQWLSEHQCQ